jgi:hypothetical protein
MEVLVQTQPKITEEKGYHIVFLDVNGEELELNNITFGRKLHNYRVNSNNPVLRSVLTYYGTCNLISTNDDGTNSYQPRHILNNDLNGHWVLASDEELRENFTEEPILS